MEAGILLENIYINNKAELEKLGVREHGHVMKMSEVHLYTLCPHCGVHLEKIGLGTHQAGLRCFATRNAHYATLSGYVRCAARVPYVNHTSPFIKRFMTKTSSVGRQPKSHKRSKGTLGFETWVERWFYDLWIAYTEQVWDPHPPEPDGDPTVVTMPKVKPKLVSKVKDGFEHIFVGLAAAKRAKSKKKIQNVLGMLDLQLAAEREP